mmetsp:Transcript_7624/g.21811  ORF Transcript_7624/g.21811 Transcript_7624/m.21811 type:complete len:226 (+) Transcript_7624:3-680(+)
MMQIGCKQGKAKALDSWYRDELIPSVKDRDPPHMTGDELVRLVEWKVTRGKFRPNLSKLAASNGAFLVQRTTERAFVQLRAIEEGGEAAQTTRLSVDAMQTLTSLKGVGPATASAIAAVVRPDIVPFTSDEAVQGVPGLAVKYDIKTFQKFMSRILEKVAALRAEAATSKPDSNGVDSDGDGCEWTALRVEEALWAHHHLSGMPEYQREGREDDEPPAKREKKQH